MNVCEAYLGSLLLDSSVYLKHPIEIEEMDISYQNLFKHMVGKIISNEPFDVVTLTTELKDEPWFCGGITLGSFMSLPMISLVPEYVSQIKKIAEQKRLTKVLDEFRNSIQSEDPEEVVKKIESCLFEVVNKTNKLPYKHVSELRDYDLSLDALKLDVDILDRSWLLNKGGLHIVAASANVGKTSLAIWLAARLCFDNKKCLFISAEMSEREMKNRFKTLMPTVDEHDLYLNCEGGIGIEEIALAARLLKKTKGLDVVFVDYLQLINTKQKFNSREQYVAHVSRSLKSLAMNLDCAVIACAQLNRQLDNKERRPMLSNLRESGSIEQDADSVAFLYRPDYYYTMLQKEVPMDQVGKVEFTIAKQRNRPTANLKCSWDKKSNTWTDWGLVSYQTKTVEANKVYGGLYD